MIDLQQGFLEVAQDVVNVAAATCRLMLSATPPCLALRDIFAQAVRIITIKSVRFDLCHIFQDALRDYETNKPPCA